MVLMGDNMIRAAINESENYYYYCYYIVLPTAAQ